MKRSSAKDNFLLEPIAKVVYAFPTCGPLGGSARFRRLCFGWRTILAVPSVRPWDKRRRAERARDR